MKRETQDRWINISSGLLTALVIIGIGYFSFTSYQKIQQAALNENAAKISDENKIAKSERIDTKEVENELNRLAEEKRLEEARIAAEKAAREKAAREKAEAERKAAEKAAQEKLAREKAEQERIIAEQKAAEKREAEKVAAEKAAAEKRAQEKLAQEKIEQERIATEKKQAEEKAAQEKAEAERKAAQEKAEAERKAAEKKAAEQKAAEEKLAQEKSEKERLEKERIEKERLAAEKKEADRKAAEAKKAEEESRIAAALNSEYFSQVHAYLYALWITPPGSYGLSTTIQFKVKEDGTIIGTPIIIKESGNEEFDNSVFVAIMSAEKVPMPSDPVVRKYLAKEGFEITYRPTN